MSVLRDIKQSKYDISTLSAASLKGLYNGTLDELRRCAELEPKQTYNDTEADRLENALLDFEQTLLCRASKIPLKTKSEITDAMDIWAKASGVNDQVDVRPSDKIVMNIFRHLSGQLSA